MGSEWILVRLASRVWSGFSWLRMGPVAACCECGGKPSGCGATELVLDDAVSKVLSKDLRGETDERRDSESDGRE
jgi:hypothetical protein